jgi:hypothetical protein
MPHVLSMPVGPCRSNIRTPCGTGAPSIDVKVRRSACSKLWQRLDEFTASAAPTGLGPARPVSTSDAHLFDRCTDAVGASAGMLRGTLPRVAAAMAATSPAPERETNVDQFDIAWIASNLATSSRHASPRVKGGRGCIFGGRRRGVGLAEAWRHRRHPIFPAQAVRYRLPDYA